MNTNNNSQPINKEINTTLFPKTDKMPVMFVGHGSPMNAIVETPFSKGFEEVAKTFPKPKAIVSVSGHWYTPDLRVTANSPLQKTIHDFGGFPEALYNIEYNAPGSPELAQTVADILAPEEKVTLDTQWGLDHGTWVVLRSMYPNADVPVIQLSMNRNKNTRYHYELGKKLKSLREHGILLLGSGSILHNLRMINPDPRYFNQGGYDWAYKAHQIINEKIEANDVEALINYPALGKEVQLAVPTPDHFLPLLFTMGAMEAGEKAKLFNDEVVMGSASMTSLIAA